MALDGLVLAQLLVEPFFNLHEGVVGDPPLHPLVDEVAGLVVGGQHPDGAPLHHGVEIPQHGLGEFLAGEAEGAALLCFGCRLVRFGTPGQWQGAQYPKKENP
ncbi:hypothetical protein D3C71_1563930 [compost metagenome]